MQNDLKGCLCGNLYIFSRHESVQTRLTLAAQQNSLVHLWCDGYREDGLQLIPVDLAVAVLVKEFEVPLEFLVDFSF